ncbi:MAG: lipid II:glycine glycyltransferase FemX [Candidatus Dormibacterales bacterium]
MTPPGGPEAWDEALRAGASPAPLLQSWAWGEVQSRSGWRVGRPQLETCMATVLMRGRGRPLAYVPRGPVPPTSDALEELAGWARRERASVLRVEPEGEEDLGADLRRLGFLPAAEVQPATTLLVELKGRDELLGSFRPKTRYNVRLAARRGVLVQEGAEGEELARQAAATARRQGISLPGASYYTCLLEVLPWCRTYVARVQGEPVAAILVARHDGRAYYLFGGSDGRHREAMPAYALQFEAMAAAADAGCRDYDLWGVPPEPDPSHPWFGLWQFKTGFGGRALKYAGCWDLVLDRSWALASRAGARVRGLAGAALRRS